MKKVTNKQASLSLSSPTLDGNTTCIAFSMPVRRFTPDLTSLSRITNFFKNCNPHERAVSQQATCKCGVKTKMKRHREEMTTDGLNALADNVFALFDSTLPKQSWLRVPLAAALLHGDVSRDDAVAASGMNRNTISKARTKAPCESGLCGSNATGRTKWPISCKAQLCAR